MKIKNDNYFSPLTPEELNAHLRRIKHVALDMDGTIYMGSQLFPFTKDFLKKLTDNGIGYSFLTNNPTRSRVDYLKKLEKLGIEATPDQMYTTAVATIEYLKANHPEVKRIFPTATPSMIKEFEEAGYEMTAIDPADKPDMLIVAFDTTITYERLCHAAWLAQQGLPYIATNPDRVCPTDQPTVLVDCGSLCKCIEWATGRTPDLVIGKPNPDMLDGIKYLYGLEADQIAMCGDRIYTDVAMAQNAGAFGVLVLSGETVAQTALEAENPPLLTAKDISVFGDLLIDSKK